MNNLNLLTDRVFLFLQVFIIHCKFTESNAAQNVNDKTFYISI